MLAAIDGPIEILEPRVSTNLTQPLGKRDVGKVIAPAIGVRRVIAKEIVSRAAELASYVRRNGIGLSLRGIPRVIYIARRLLPEGVDDLLRNLPAEINKKLESEVKSFVNDAEQHDDITFVVVKTY